MIVESGHFALILAFCVACVQATLPLYGAHYGHARLMALAGQAAQAQFILLLWAFCALTIAFVTSDFSVQLVANNSHAAKPLIYKFAGVWGNHEGSMLLWILILSAYGAGAAKFGHQLPLALKARALAVQGFLGVCFLAFCLFTSNPFARLVFAPFEGSGLNPILQDPALAAHPPLLYAGYVGFSMAFSFSIAVLLGGAIHRAWARWVRPWVLLAWIFLTLGIALGSFWAYYELGWGGFWFWDPVENASLMPWLSGTALLHSALVSEQRDAMRRWTILLAILTFGLSITGTFLVRSGVLTSVHAFANDPERGVFVLAILAVTVGGALILYAFKASKIAQTQPKPFDLISREGALLANNVFLASATATVFIGTLYPLAIDVLGMGKISVGAPYYNAVLIPLVIPLILLIPFGPLLGWGIGKGVGRATGKGSEAVRRLKSAALLSLLFVATIMLMRGGFHQTDSYQGGAILGLAGAAWLVFGSLANIVGKIGFSHHALYQSLQRLWRLSGHLWGSALAHAGIGIMLFGIVCTTAWKAEEITIMQIGDKVKIAGYHLELEQIQNIDGPNYRAEQGVFRIMKGDNIYRLKPARRFYDAERSQTTEAAILKHFSAHLYIALGEKVEGEAYIIRAWVHPFVAFIWIGALVMAFGGGTSLVSRWRRGDVAGKVERMTDDG